MARILLIDDETLVRKALRVALEVRGHVVETAENGRTGVAAARASRFDLVVTDLLMPEQEGIETIGLLRQIDPSPLIVAISGGSRTGGFNYLGMARKLGADDCLQKPFSATQLHDCIETCLRQGRRPPPDGSGESMPP